MDVALGGMAERIDSFDWSRTVLGARADWPASLRVMVNVALRTRFPMLVFWGRDLIQLYNDAFVPILGARHPAALAQPARECWPEIWDTIGPLLHGALEAGEPVWAEDMAFTLERNGYPEETFFTFSYSQFGEPGEEGGVLCTCVETTASVFRERDFRAMADTIADIIYTHAPDGTVEWANSRWYEYSKLPADIATKPEGWAHVLPPEDFELFIHTLDRAFQRGEAYEAEVRFKPFHSDDAAYRWHLVRAVPMRGSDGKIVRWAGSATDIHDRRTVHDAMRARLERDFDREHRASIAFQTAALPRTLPSVPGISFDAIYEAAERNVMVGGDWYDAFRLSDGRVVLSVGDVAGSGLEAAVAMSAARQAIRGSAQMYPAPAAVLDAADRALRSEQPDRIVTAFVGIVDPVTRSLSYASAGHPSPLLREANGTVIELQSYGLPLGLRNVAEGDETRVVAIPEGALLVLYTDGLIESTRDLLEGERRLRAALESERVAMAAFPAAALRDAILSEASDDVAILTVHFGARPNRIMRWTAQLTDPLDGARIRQEFADALRESGASGNDVADAELVIGELLGNVVRHTGGIVDVWLDLTSTDPVLHVLDRGPGYTFHAHLPNDAMSESGRGLYIASRLAGEISVVPRQSGGSHARVVLAVTPRRQST
jgi:PAS domain-containing protein/anti-sigma regulatory factor (Ser/Thr protein kinase)